MPIELAIWGLAGSSATRLAMQPLDLEKRLEKAILSDLSLVSPELLLIASQVYTDHGGYIDILAIDAEGHLAVIELKRNRTPRDAVAQLLDYASWVGTLSYDEVKRCFEGQHPGEAFEKAFAARFGNPPEEVNGGHQLMLVCSELDPASERIISYLTKNHGVPINAVFFRCFHDSGRDYLARSWLIEPEEAEATTERAGSTRASKRETWNGRDYYAAYGGDEQRVWDDARRYGFISAGGGPWYTRPLFNLKPGHRVHVHLPEEGYVGVGEVVGEAAPIRDFKVDVDGKRVGFLEAPRQGFKQMKHLDNDETTEFMVPVKWIKTLPRSEAYWEKGMFANQASACKLRQSFTLERLRQRFGLQD